MTKLSPIAPEFDTALRHGVHFRCRLCGEEQFFPLPYTWIVAFTAAVAADWLDVPIPACFACIGVPPEDEVTVAPGWNEFGLPDF